jgi:membrane protein YdbS with pleckstrin-like domain
MKGKLMLRENRQIIVIRILTVVIYLVCGVGIQLLLWKTPERTFYEAITHWGLLWVVYLFVTMFIAEHLHNRIRRCGEQRVLKDKQS